MLALQKRQHIPYNQTSTLPSPPSSQQLSFDELSQQLSTLSAQEQLYNQKLLHDYLESQQQSFATHVIVDSELPADPNQFMNGTYDFSSPTIRIQESTPTPQQPSGFSQSSMLAANNATASGLESWNTFANNGQMDDQSLQTPVQSRAGRTHQRASSSSSIGSNRSQYQAVTHANNYPYVAHSENSPSTPAVKFESSYGADEASRAFSNHLPTPTHTPIQDSFMSSNLNNFTSNPTAIDSTMAAHFSMKHALMDQQVPEEDVPGFGHSARHSVSSYGLDSPATPHTAHGEDFEDRFKMPPSGEILSNKVDSWFDEYLAYDDEPDLRHTVPKFERTYTDAALDTFYDPSNTAQSMQQAKPAPNASLLSPYRNSHPNDIVQRTLQAAQNARSQSPSSSVSRGVSPFRQNSPFHGASNKFSSPRVRVGTAARAREQQKAEADAYALKHLPQNEEAQPKTISPKDALLDYREADEESKVPLFPDGGASEYEHQYNGGDQYRNATQSSFDTTSAQSYRRDSWATPQFSSNYTTTSSGPSPSSSSFTFAPPSISGNMHGLPYTQQQYRPAPNNMPSASEQTPEFPAHLTSMESSASEAGPETSSQEQIQKPTASNADTGTYTCTYHGCTLRFETPQKLQKHKREGHRNVNTANIGSSMTSAALLDRNSQAGPHKCERINPTTGKPCNTIFSRPYDLTRHEDTIHNARKQKVRCALCVEEKTFSRNDALTRHMRVVHPEIDFPGKHRRRGGNHD
ncbi:hypothetical protein K469DRAFT_727340 [Zopfia rhizophila CBS 207.26]|uniref:C2H2-type domain-containing protein n=1 Tax=Zopfia rhizophila CBS 207.26 TaxID=1314779 RepID=A0A6A6E2T2_9PEZI|nr:hypothetical protein K469DRAFT_727340 [Zopfia rhizophila CBS 207.26]